MKHVIVAIGLVLVGTGCVKPPDANSGPSAQVLGTVDPKTGKPMVKIEVLAEGEGEPAAAPGKTVVLHVVGKTLDGAEFHNTLDTLEPVTMNLIKGQSLDGFIIGLAGARKGEKRRLTIPPELYYGRQGTKKIPPNSTVVVEVDVLSVH